MIKKLLISLVSIILLTIINSSTYAQNNDDDPKSWKYFSIYADVGDDSIFIDLQNDIGLDPKMTTYTVIVNIDGTDKSNHYLVIGDENSSHSLKVNWKTISKKVRDGLLNWDKPNKVKK